MTQRFSSYAWLAWTIAAAFCVLVTRNPLYLTILATSVLTVYLSLERRSSMSIAWSTVLRIGVVIAAISILFNVLTVQTGDRPFGSLPDEWPIIGGALTWNAALYGAISGLALLSLLLIAASLSTAVDRSALVRLVPERLGSTGIAAAAALSVFPQTIQSFGQVREAHRARGLPLRSVRDVQRLVVPVLNIGLERAFHTAETMESRAFGNRGHNRDVPAGWAITAIGLATSGVILVGIGHLWYGVATFAVALALFVALVRVPPAERAARYRTTPVRRTDLPLLAAAGLTIGIVGFELVRSGGSLAYSTYPSIMTPPFDLLVGIAYVLLVIPAIATSERSIAVQGPSDD